MKKVLRFLLFFQFLNYFQIWIIFIYDFNVIFCYFFSPSVDLGFCGRISAGKTWGVQGAEWLQKRVFRTSWWNTTYDLRSNFRKFWLFGTRWLKWNLIGYWRFLAACDTTLIYWWTIFRAWGRWLFLKSTTRLFVT